MSKGKTINVTLELNDGIGIVDGLQIVQNALKAIDTKCEIPENGVVEWDISKNVPGYIVKMRDEGIGAPTKFGVGKAKRVRKGTPAA